MTHDMPLSLDFTSREEQVDLGSVVFGSTGGYTAKRWTPSAFQRGEAIYTVLADEEALRAYVVQRANLWVDAYLARERELRSRDPTTKPYKESDR
jgi:hypothetical protein